MQGRNPKTVAEKNISGSLQISRLRQELPVQKLQILPRPPRFLSKIAKNVYHTKGSELLAEGILSSLDLELFTAFCVESAKYFELSEKIQALDPEKNRGSFRLLLQMQNSAFVRMSYLSNQFGLSPLARQKFIRNVVDPDQLSLEMAFENL